MDRGTDPVGSCSVETMMEALFSYRNGQSRLDATQEENILLKNLDNDFRTTNNSKC